ncbi:type II toxin-antitoxin system RelB/DinJ family antitoxin [Burkholderia cepacia]|uniref:type II toxin-antitoxin system RelB/DinJ family antitoxin n=1 Tax=Burkholderia cepacia TaxID=292 RepID=UPI002990087F|nr:type II toxin-antitoxin system RelB/DinJ family antitoxin [Burkholderia cepacia]
MVAISVDNKTADVRTRIEPELKDAARKILAGYGLTMSEASRLFFRQVVLQKGLPFDLRQPNETTLEALRESREMQKARFGSVTELIDELEKERK